MKRCKICFVAVNEVDSKGRCQSCADAGDATRAGLHYGDYIAARDAARIRPIPLPVQKPEPVSRANAVKVCRICGALIPPESPRRTLCSPECQAEYNRRSANEAHAKAKAKRLTQPIPERFCVICGKRITSPRKKVTCSPECAVTYKRQWERDRKRKLKQKGNAK